MYTYCFTCMCGRTYKHKSVGDKWSCKCGADLSILEKPHAIQPMVTLPDSVGVTDYLAKSKYIRSKIEVEKS